MTLLARRRVLAVKTETTVGTYNAVGASDAAFFSYDALMQQTTEMIERPSPNGFGTIASITGGYMATCTFKTDLRWNGTGVPAYLATLMAACGVVNNSGTLTPRTEAPGTNVKTLSIGLYEDGKLRTMRGACGTFRMVCQTGQPVIFEWTFTGIWNGETDTSIVDPTYPSDETVIRAAGGATTLNSVAMCYSNLTFDVQNQVEMIECPTTVSGFHAALIANRKPLITIDPEAKLVATRGTMNDFLSSTERAFSCAWDGPSTSTITFAAPKAQVIAIPEGERKGLVVDQLSLQCNKDGNTEDNDFSLVFA